MDDFRDRMPRPQMETYSAAQGKGWLYNALPGPITTVYGLLASGSVTGLAYFIGDSSAPGQGYKWSIIAIAAMTLLGLLVFLVSARRARAAAKARAGGFENAVKGSAAGWDTAGSNVQEIARLDDMRAKFQKGIETFAEHGKNLYELPWYVMVGEPSSGKSEAIRRSELRFPQGLQDKLQGVGGTHSMNWWFTNHAVILDTAGAILMDPEAAQRFEEFLKLLRIHRTDYPINGLILTLPVDKLLTDPPHVAEEKARTIAAQLSIVQKALDVRFPLFVMVSKSDRLPGFREFVDADGQTNFEPQICGWSNPAPLDEPFDVARLEEAMDCISSRLQRRVFKLLADPVSRQAGQRRLDEVDSIYSFPSMLRTLTPRLQCYLEVLFQTGTWASKPPFFRGLYFTSAMRESNELDQALAKAMNMDVQMLPTGGIFAPEKSVFLRDLFLAKIFLEKGLVTRLKNVGALLRRRLVAFFGIAAGLVAIGLAGAFMVHKTLKAQLDSEQSQWAAANETWDNGTVLPLITRQNTGQGNAPRWIWNEEKTGGSSGRGRLSRLELVKELEQMTQAPPKLSWVFHPLPEWRDFERRRRDAALTVIEASIIKPVLDAARERMIWDTAHQLPHESEVRMAEAFEQLALLEAWVVNKGKPSKPDDPLSPPNQARWTAFFTKLLDYTLDRPPGGTSPAATEAMARLALVAGFRDHSWMAEAAPDRSPSALAEAAHLLFGKAADEAALSAQQREDNRRAKEKCLGRFTDTEKQLVSWSTESLPRLRSDIETQGMEPLRNAAQDYQDQYSKESGLPTTTLTPAQIEHIAKTTMSVLDATEPAGESPLKSSREFASMLSGRTQVAVSPDNVDAKWKAALMRLDHYKESFASVSPERAHILRSHIIGSLAAKLLQASAMADELAKTPAVSAKAPDAAAPASTGDAIVAFLSKYRGSSLMGEVFRSYVGELGTTLKSGLKFPLVQGAGSYSSLDQCKQFCESLNPVEKDMTDFNVATNPAYFVAERQLVVDLFDHLQAVLNIKKILQTGLEIDFSGVGPPIKMVKPGQPEKKSGGFLGMGGTTTPAVAPSIDTSGITDFTIIIDGVTLISGAPTTNQFRFPWNGYAPVEVKVDVTPSGSLAAKKNSSSNGRGWELLQSVASGKSAFPIGTSGTSFSILVKSPSPPFPSPWPKISQFSPPTH